MDDKIDKIVKRIFEQMKALNKGEVVANRCRQEVAELKTQLTAARGDLAKASKDLDVLKDEVVKAILGQSKFSQEMLSGLIDEKQKDCDRLKKFCHDLETKMENSQQRMEELSKTYDELISWADLYDKATIETKKMIVSALIERVEVGKGYSLNIKLKMNLYQFLFGLDEGFTA